MINRIGIVVLSMLFVFILGFFVYKTLKVDSKCFQAGGVLIKTTNGQFCIKEDAIIKE
jgi:hypothetical protein